MVVLQPLSLPHSTKSTPPRVLPARTHPDLQPEPVRGLRQHPAELPAADDADLAVQREGRGHLLRNLLGGGGSRNLPVYQATSYNSTVSG